MVSPLQFNLEEKMKYLAIMFLTVSLAASAQAQRQLKDVMSDLGDNFKAVSMGLQTGKMTPQMLKASELIIKFVTESETIIPDTILSLPNVERPAAIAKYTDEIKALETSAISFNNALKSGNISAAKIILVQLTAQKKQGHSDFK